MKKNEAKITIKNYKKRIENKKKHEKKKQKKWCEVAASTYAVCLQFTLQLIMIKQLATLETQSDFIF